MKANKFFAFSLILVFAGTAMALSDYVDVGDPMDAAYTMTSWGPAEPATHGGNYGGIDDCRAIWTNFDTPVPGSRSAFIDLNFAGGAELVAFRHLDGMADDGFEVFLDGTLVYTHIDATTTEMWFTSGFYTPATLLAGTHILSFVATGQQWSGWATWGQVCISDIWVGDEGVVPPETSNWGDVKSLYR